MGEGEILKIVYVYADSPGEWNCSEWNCIIPTKAINKTGKHTAEAIYINDFVKNTEESQKICGEADVIVVERNYFADTLTMISYWKARNKTILAIFDDAYDKMHPQNISYGFWTHGELSFKDKDGNTKMAKMIPPPLEQFKWALRMVKGIQVPSVGLAEDWSRFGKTYFVHNYLDIEKYQGDIQPLLPYDGITIGWCGSMSHYSSFTDSGVLQALRKVSKRNPDVRVLIGGDKRIFDILETKNKVFQKYVPADQWTSLLKSLSIGLAPLSGEYDKRRSWVKVLEYMILKIPWIATDYPTYSELKDYGKITENGYRNWEQGLTDMIENYDAYKQKAETDAYNFALKQTSDANIEKVTLALYEKLLTESYPLSNTG